MTLRLNGSTSGHTEIKAPAAAGDNTITLPTSNGSANQFLMNSGTAGELEFSSMVETSTGVGIGTSSPSSDLHVEDASATCSLSIVAGDTTSNSNIQFGDQDDINVGLISYNHTDNALSMRTGGTGQQFLIDSDGHTHLGPRTGNNNATSFSDAIVNICGPDDIATSFSKAACYLHLGNNESTLSGIYPLGFGFTSADRTHVPAYIAYITEDAAGAENGPLVFATRDVTTDTAPSERMRIQNNGRLGLGMTAPAGRLHVSENSTTLPGMYVDTPSGSYGADNLFLRCGRGNNSGYTFLVCQSAYTGSADNEFILRGDGRATADDSWNGGGADYAEYFEWSDGNTEAEDRRGISVVLDGDKLREAVTGEEPIGVISGNPSVVGDADIERWKHKYLRDDFGTYIRDEEGDRQLNPNYDPDAEYVSRENRPEWDTVGLMGKLRIRKGQVTGARWIKMRDVSDTVEEWLVR